MRRGTMLIALCYTVLICGFNSRTFAQLNEWRTEVQVSVGQGTGLQFEFDGGLNEPSSFVTLVTSGASPQASSSLDADGYIPTLRVKADASPTRSQAVAWGVQGYTNASGGPLDTGLVLNLSANISGSNNLSARVYLFEDDNFQYSFDSGTILFESTSQLWPGFESFARLGFFSVKCYNWVMTSFSFD